MKKLKLIVLFSVFTSINIFAQTTEKLKKKKYKISNAYFLAGGSVYKENFVSKNEFLKLNPTTGILTGLTNDYEKTKGGINFTSNINFGIGITKYKPEKDNYKSTMEFRVGIGCSSNNIMNSYYHKEETTRIDTLISSQSGNNVYYDLVTSKNYSMKTVSNQIRLDASVIFKTNTEKKASLYAGAGIDAGTSFNSYTYINYYEYATYKLSSDDINGINEFNSKEVPWVNYNEESEKIKMKSQLAASVYLPIGINFGVGSKREFFKRFIGFVEVRPFLNYNSVPELHRSFVNIGMRSGVGLQVNF